MPSIVLCLHAHVPLRLKKYGFFDIGRSEDYFDAEQSRQIVERVAKDSYLPLNRAMLKLIRRYRGGFRVSCSVSGMLLEQLETGPKAVLESFRRLADTGCAEFLCGPCHHSLASLFSEREFRRQIILHKRKIRALFGQVPLAFRNTELLYGNDVARIAESMGFRVILAGGAGRLSGCGAEVLHRPAGCRRIKVLLRSDRFSNPVALRPSEAQRRVPSSDEHIQALIDGHHGDEVINIFVNYEAFIGCNPVKNGMPEFPERLAGVLLRRRNWKFSTPSEAAAEHEPAGQIDVPGRLFQEGPEGDDPVWLGNHMQVDSSRTLYQLQERVRATKNRKWIGAWRNLQASDYFYSMGTKGLPDDATHRTESSFESPYDTYIHYMSILRDFSGRIAGKTGVGP